MKKLLLIFCLVSVQAQAQEVYNFYFQKKAEDPAATGAPVSEPKAEEVTLTPAKPEPAKRSNRYIHLGLANWNIAWHTDNGRWNNGTFVSDHSNLGFNGVVGTLGYHFSPKWGVETQGIFGNSNDADQGVHQSIYSGSATYDAVSTSVYGRTVFDLYVLAGASYIANWYGTTGAHGSLRGQLTLADNFGAFVEYRRYVSFSDIFSRNADNARQTVPDQLTTLSVALNF